MMRQEFNSIMARLIIHFRLHNCTQSIIISQYAPKMQVLLIFLQLILMSFASSSAVNDTLVFDFGSASDKINYWGSVNDGVMGGRSSGKTSYSANSLIFEGSISFENNGGFASVRCPYQDFNLADYKNVRIRYRASGQTFALSLNTSRRFYLPNYRVYLTGASTKPNEWVETTIPLSDFKQHRMGNPTGYGISKEALNKVIQLTFISADKKEGPFSFEVDYLIFE